MEENLKLQNKKEENTKQKNNLKLPKIEETHFFFYVPSENKERTKI